MWTVSQEKDEVWDAEEGSTGAGRVEHQLPGRGQHKAVQRGKERSGKMMEQQTDNAQHSAKPKGVEPKRIFLNPVLSSSPSNVGSPQGSCCTSAKCKLQQGSVVTSK